MSESARNSIEKFRKKIEDAKAKGIGCGCNCGGLVDFEKPINHLESVYYSCDKCGLIHDSHGHAVFFTAYSRGYYKDGKTAYEPGAFPDDTQETGKDVDPKVAPCQDNACAGIVDTTEEILVAFDTFGICKKCSLLHTKTGGRQLFTYAVRGYFRNGKIVFPN